MNMVKKLFITCNEKTKDEEKLLNSTNMSDGLKYLLCRPEFLELLTGEYNLFESMC